MVYGVEKDRAVVDCSKTREKAVPRVLEAADRFMVRWHEDEAYLSRQRCSAAVGRAHENGLKPKQGNAGRGANMKSRRETAVDGCGKETAHRVATHRAD